jgi:hypothetical protein
MTKQRPRLGLPRRGEARRTNAPIPRSIHMNVTDGSGWHPGNCGTAAPQISKFLATCRSFCFLPVVS